MRCIELFAGAGGAALGLDAAGIEHAALCEWDPHACATLRAAGLGPVVEGDVRDLDAIAAVAGESCDLLWSSFPCQAWSTAGKQRGAEDERNGWPWTVDAIDRFSPRWFLAENVRGLIQHSEEGHPDPQKCPRCYFETVILAQLRERFACVGWWVLNAADFGVPQMRHRVIIWAGPKPIRAPRPTHGPPLKARQGDLFGPGVLPWVTVADALGLHGHTHTQRTPETAKGGNLWQPTTIPSGTVPTHAMHFREMWSINRRPPVMHNHKPSPTIDCYVQSSGDGYEQATRIIDNTGRRRMHLTEAATLQNFPDCHPWQGPQTARFRQVGNAVPPKLAEVVGRALMAAEQAA